MTLMPNTLGIYFVEQNINPLKCQGIYEKALVYAVTSTRVNHSHWTADYMEYLFGIGDREKLITAGDPLPAGDVYTIYRGVAGKGQRRKVRGISWTALLDVACWFAIRYSGRGLRDPAVYKGKIRKKDVYCYFQGRNEEEFICRPKSAKRLDMTLEEMCQSAHAYTSSQ